MSTHTQKSQECCKILLSGVCWQPFCSIHAAVLGAGRRWRRAAWLEWERPDSPVLLLAGCCDWRVSLTFSHPSSRCSRDGGARVCPPRSPVRLGASSVVAAVESLPSTLHLPSSPSLVSRVPHCRPPERKRAEKRGMALLLWAVSDHRTGAGDSKTF